MLIRKSKICDYLAAIVCARVLGQDGCPEALDEESDGIDQHSLQKCQYEEWATVIVYGGFG